ncbi:lysostaphin resistance A-like protein [Neobacillus sp. SCS-31]|uniref:CPBP family intramembrane glutamic endopeptidase n=1 Tax=Neobacillus oceani TaxID=3115292 RepID=UPI003905C33B
MCLIHFLEISFTITPFAEELLFRGYLFNKWGETLGISKAMVLTSLLFSILHLNSGFIGHFVFGLFCCIVYIKTKRLIVSIILHALNNLIAGLPILGAKFGVEDAPIESGVITEYTEKIILFFNISAIAFLFLIPIVIIILYRYYKSGSILLPYQSNFN